MDNEARATHPESASTYDVFLVGVGGQGVLTIGDILAEAALGQGTPVNLYPTKGMAQRGGFVKAQVRLGRLPCLAFGCCANSGLYARGAVYALSAHLWPLRHRRKPEA